jgi:hypothetical protein
MILECLRRVRIFRFFLFFEYNFISQKYHHLFIFFLTLYLVKIYRHAFVLDFFVKQFLITLTQEKEKSTIGVSF